MTNRPIHHAMVLGGTGFMGSSLINHLSSLDIRTTALIHETPGTFNKIISTLPGSITHFDWSKLDGDQPDVIFHLARIPGKGTWGRRLSALFSYYANKRLINWMQSLNDPPLLVLVAGTLGYGDHEERVINELTPLSPISFAREYHFGELPVINADLDYKLPIITIRPSWVYALNSWFKSYFLKPMLQQGVPMYGTGDNWMSLIHVDDVAGLMVHIVKHGQMNQTYNLFSESPIRQHQFVNQLSRIWNLPVNRISKQEIVQKGGQAAMEALTFSLRVNTIHKNLYQRYSFRHPDYKQWLHDIHKQMERERSWTSAA